MTDGKAVFRDGITDLIKVEESVLAPIVVTEEVPRIEVLRQAKLTSLEKTEMENFVALNLPGIQNYPKTQLLEAYLGGCDSSELIQMFDNVSLGGIAYLKAKDNWIERRKEFLEDLQYRAKLKLLQTKNQSVSLLSLLIGSFHKEIQPGILKYLQTGDKKHLPKRFSINSFNDYSRFMKLLETTGRVQTGPGKAEPTQMYPPISIQADNVTLNDNSRPNSNMSSQSPENISDSAFEFLKTMYTDKK